MEALSIEISSQHLEVIDTCSDLLGGLRMALEQFR